MSSLRASDSDRERAAGWLRRATVEGRLTPDELEERLEALYGSRTYGELDALVADLPVSRPPRAPVVRPGLPWWAAIAGATTLLVAFLGLLGGAAEHRTGEAVMGPTHRGQFAFTALPPESHHVMISAASRLAVLALLVVCGAVAWLLIRSRHRSGS